MLSKDDIRRQAIRRGSYDLDDPESRLQLETYVNRYYLWYQSGLWKNIGPEALSQGPATLLQAVSSPSNQTPERFVSTMIGALRSNLSLFIHGTGGTYVATVLAMNATLAWGIKPIPVTASDLLDPSRTLPRGKTCLVLGVYTVGGGNLWLEHGGHIDQQLSNHWGPKILHSTASEVPKDDLSRCIFRLCDLKPPRIKKVSLREAVRAR